MKQYEFKKEYDKKGREQIVLSNESKRRLDIVPRLVCLLLALIIWIYCVNINETDVTTTFNVKLNVVGAESMANGMSIYSTSNVTEVRLTVQGNNRDINRYTASDYYAYIDVSEIGSVGWSTQKIMTELPDGSSLSLISMDIDAVSVYVDVSAETYVPIEIKLGAIKQPAGYSLSYEIEDGINRIQIKGPKTLIDTISKAEYVLEGEFNKSTTISGSALALDFYNDQGELISSKNSGDVSLSSIRYDTGKMNINAIVTALVPLKIKAIGSNQNYTYEVLPISANVTGDPEILNSLSDYVIDVEDRGVGEYEYTISAEQFKYPEGVKLVDESVTVTVVITERAMGSNSRSES